MPIVMKAPHVAMIILGLASLGLCQKVDTADVSFLIFRDTVRVKVSGSYPSLSTCSGEIALDPAIGVAGRVEITQDSRPKLTFSLGFLYANHVIANNEVLAIYVETDSYEASDWSFLRVMISGKYSPMVNSPLAYWGEGSVIGPFLIGDSKNNVEGIGLSIGAGITYTFKNKWQIYAEGSYGYISFGGATVNGTYGTFDESYHSNAFAFSIGISTPVLFTFETKRMTMMMK